MFPHQRFEVRGVEAESGVAVQPFTDDETLRGAQNRAHNVRVAVPDADYHVGIEGGVEPHGDGLMAFAWVVILGAERSGKAKTGGFMLPQEVTQLVRQGIELGVADDRVFGRSGSKRDTGSVGILTGDVMTRATFYSPAVILALIPFKNPSLTFE